MQDCHFQKNNYPVAKTTYSESKTFWSFAVFILNVSVQPTFKDDLQMWAVFKQVYPVKWVNLKWLQEEW